MTQALSDFVNERFALHTGLDVRQIVNKDYTLAEIISNSDGMNNSLDLMEAFARTANDLKKHYGVRIRLPSFPLDTRISVVLRALGDQLSETEAQGEHQDHGNA